MILFKDVISGDEMFCNRIFTEVEGTSGALIKVVCKMKAEDGSIPDHLIGANASEECGSEALNDQVKIGIDVVMDSRLEIAPPYKKDPFVTYLKAFSKRVIKKLEEEGLTTQAEDYKASAQLGAKYLVKHLKEFELYTGENQDPEGGMAYLGYEEDGITPFFLFFQHTLIKEKV